MTPLKVVEQIYARFNEGDIEAVAALLAPDIEWVEPEGYFLPQARGSWRGRDLVLGLFAEYPSYWESSVVTPDHVFEAIDGRHVFVLGTQSGRGRDSKRGFTGPFVNLWEIENHLAVRHVSIADTATVQAALATA
jgi:ketosteroid isomerase-like protein